MKIKLECPVCRIDYEADSQRLKFGRQTTCSRKCSYEFRAKKISKGKFLVCPVCGTQFYRPPSQIKAKHKSTFCSPACQYKGRTVGLTKRIVSKPYLIKKIFPIERRREIMKRIWANRRINGTDRHTEEVRRKMSEITSRNIATGKINRISEIEYKVSDKLRSLGVNFVHQWLIRNNKTGRFCACCDFYLPDFNIVIEVNGTFWHADPRFFSSDNLRPAQIRTLSKYADKITILRALNIPIIEIWEHDIRKSPEHFIDPLMKHIGIG